MGCVATAINGIALRNRRADYSLDQPPRAPGDIAFYQMIVGLVLMTIALPFVWVTPASASMPVFSCSPGCSAQVVITL